MKWWQQVLLVAALVVAVVAGLFLIPVKGGAAAPTVTLDWTAPGDDGNVGTAAFYEMRFAPTPVGADTLAWWNAATPVPGLPNPQVAGTTQSVVVSSGLSWATTYYFVMRATDDGLPQADGVPAPNTSGWSNVARIAFGPAPDTEAPARIIDLIAR